MTLPLRTAIFWVHLAAGLLAGLIIGIMSVTGVALAFEKELVTWAERDARHVSAPASGVTPLPLDELLERARAAGAQTRLSNVVVASDPSVAVAATFGRDGTYFINPYTGEVRQPASTRMHDVLHVLEDWHRWLALSGEARASGKVINGTANLIFFALGVTGLYIWWPRRWSWRALKPSVWFTGAQGKARDWNWHNVIGLWCSPVLIVLTLTALPISFRWAGNGIYALFGETPPTQGGPAAAAPVAVPTPAPDAKPVGYGALLASVQKESPAWQTVTFRLGAGRGQGGPAQGTRLTPRQEHAASAGPGMGSGAGRGAGRAEAGTPQATTAVSVLVKEIDAWPKFATVQYALNPFTAEVLRKETFTDASTARKVRSWTRFLHTGEAFGGVGQFVAGLACLGGVFLVYTGFALSWRRFFPSKAKTNA